MHTTPRLVQIAQQRGSSATTTAGARRWLLAHLPGPHAGLLATEGRARPMHTPMPWKVRTLCVPGNGRLAAQCIPARAAWARAGRPERIARGAAMLCTALGLPTRPEWVALQLAAGNTSAAYDQCREAQHAARTAADYVAQVLAHTLPLAQVASLPASTWRDATVQYVRIGQRTIALQRHEATDWGDNRRRNRHFPAASTVTRTAHLLRADWDDCSAAAALRRATIDGNRDCAHTLQDATERQIDYSARGAWLIGVVAELLHIPAEPAAKALRAVQLNPHCRVELDCTRLGVQIYRRTVGGELLDWCAVARGTTYHAATPRAAVRGLAGKLAAADDGRDLLTLQYAIQLGFCRAGVEQFCADYEINPAGAYRRSALRQIVAARPQAIATYRRELKTARLI